MKFILASDPHQQITKWNDLVPVVKNEWPRFVLIAGDLLPKGTFGEQKEFFVVMRRLFQDLKQFGPVTVLTYLGNGAAHVLEPLLDQLQAEGLSINLNGLVHREEGFVFCGMNRVRENHSVFAAAVTREGHFTAQCVLVSAPYSRGSVPNNGSAPRDTAH